MRHFRSERGSIPLALLVVIAAAGIMAALVSRTVAAQRQVRFDENFTTALPIADAGLETALFRLNANANLVSDVDGGTYPRARFPLGHRTVDHTQTLNGQTFTWYLQRDPGEWTVRSSAVVNGVERVVEGTIEEDSLPLVAAFADTLVSFNGANSADSYDSGTGDTCTGHGIVGSNEVVAFSGSSGSGSTCARPGGRTVDQVHLFDWTDNPATGTSPNYPGGSRCQHSGGASQNCREHNANVGTGNWPAPYTFEDKQDLGSDDSLAFITGALAACGTSLSDYRTSVNGPLAPAPNADIAIDSGAMDTPDAYHCFENMYFDADTTLNGATVDDPVIVFVRRAVEITRSHTRVNCAGCTNGTLSTPPAGNLLIFVLEGDISVRNQSQFAGVLYGPRADCSGGAQADIYGSLVCDTIANVGGWSFHYDDALGDIGNGEFELADWREELVGP